MELVVFDLDGTLLDASAQISPFTRETLMLLAANGIAYTVATGRARHAAQDILASHRFELPQAFKNGVLIWDPKAAGYSHHQWLTAEEIGHVVDAMAKAAITPFLSTLEADGQHRIFHPPIAGEHDQMLASSLADRPGVSLHAIAELPWNAEISSISGLGSPAAVAAIEVLIAAERNLVAYGGPALEGPDLAWIDIHHVDGTKGNAVQRMSSSLGVERVICFGDSDNDLSMFEIAHEAYAPRNALDVVKDAATEVIGHHDEDGIARFLRDRFSL